MKCKYWKECEGFDENAYTCNDRTAENGYCGLYRLIQLEKESEKKKSTLFKKIWKM